MIWNNTSNGLTEWRFGKKRPQFGVKVCRYGRKGGMTGWKDKMIAILYERVTVCPKRVAVCHEGVTVCQERVAVWHEGVTVCQERVAVLAWRGDGLPRKGSSLAWRGVGMAWRGGGWQTKILKKEWRLGGLLWIGWLDQKLQKSQVLSSATELAWD